MMIYSPCWNCVGAGRPNCDICQGTGRFRTTRRDAWSRRKLFFGTPRTKAEKAKVDANGNEKWTRYSAETPPEFDELFEKLYRKLGHREEYSRAAITRIALFTLLEREDPDPEEGVIEAHGEEMRILPVIEAGQPL